MDFDNFFGDDNNDRGGRTPLYHTPDPQPAYTPPKRTNAATIIAIVIAAIMCVVVIVNVIVLATLKDSISKEYAAKMEQQIREQYSDAISDQLNNQDIIDKVVDQAANSAVDKLNKTIGEVGNEVAKSVAQIYMYTNATDRNPSSAATAFLITDPVDGTRYMITNAHVVKYESVNRFGTGTLNDYARLIAVFENDNNLYAVESVYCGYYREELPEDTSKSHLPDLAVLKFTSAYPSADAHPTLKLADSDYTTRGAEVAIVGNPDNYGITVTTGTVSYNASELSGNAGKFILTDAAVNPGNSGGPMINRSGVVVGVVESKIVDDKIDNMGFAVAIETLIDFIEEAKRVKGVNIPYKTVGLTE